jgi:rod shape-determining protein MreD
VVAILLLQEGLLHGMRIAGIRPELLLGAGIVAGVVGTPEGGAVLAFVAGVAADLFVATPFGLTALVASIVAYGCGSAQQAMGVSNRWSVLLLTGSGTLIAVAAWAALGTVLGLPGLLVPRLAVVAAVVAGANAIIAVPLAPVMRWVFAGLPGVVTAPNANAGRGFLA